MSTTIPPGASGLKAPQSTGFSRYPLMTRGEVEDMIARGHHVFIVNQHVLKVDPWIQYHPGGDKAIMHVVGRDATDEVNAFHGAEALRAMGRYKIGRIEGRWKNFIPPIQGGTFGLRAGPSASAPPALASPVGSEEAEHSGHASEPSTRSPSPSESPLFDSDAPFLRRRGPGRDGTGRPASLSSGTSAEEEEISEGMGYLDIETRKEISLDLDKYPSLDDSTQQDIVEKYRALDERIRARGLYQCKYRAYAIEIARYLILAGLALFFLRRGFYALSGAFLAALWHQIVFTVHDAGHLGITHNLHVDSAIGIFLGDYIGGLSIGWWKRNHNVHHIVTNSPENDPDIEHLPFFAISHRFLSSLRSSYYDRVMEYDGAAKILISLQAWLYYPIMAFGRFNLYRLSWDHLIARRGPRKGPARWQWWAEVGGQFFFWAWFGYGVLYRSIPTTRDRIVFVLISHTLTAILHVQITLSHFAMSTADLGPHESFPQRMLRTTMDVDCPQWLDFFHGGLQFQVIHHLFPRIPRHNLRETQKLVQEFCNDVGIPYALYGFADGNGHVIGKLAEVSRQAAILAKCHKSLAKHGGSH